MGKTQLNMAKPEMEINISIEVHNQKFINALNDALIEVMAAAQQMIERTQPRPKKEIIGFRNGKILHVKKKI